MKEIAKLKINLMEKNIEVAKFEIEIYDRFVTIDEYEVLSPSHMPAIVEHIGMLNWLLSRCMSYTTHWQAFLFDSILQNGERNKFAPFILSLNTNSMSVSDWYWLKPEQNIEFQYYAQKIEFLLTTWEQSNWFDHKDNIDSFNHNMGKDVFIYDEYTQPLKAPVFAIHGDAQSQLILRDSKICIKQRKTKEKIQDELNCLMELGKAGVVVPTIKTEHTGNCLDTKMFNYATRQNGMDFIIKDILTSNCHKLVPLEWFWKNVDSESMQDIVRNVEQLTGFNITNIDAAKAIDDHFVQHSLTGIDGTNVGFLVDEHRNAQLAAWSNIALR